MTKHKQAKTLRRSKQKQKEIREHRDSWRSKSLTSTPLEHPKPLSEEEILAQKKPIKVKRPDEPVARAKAGLCPLGVAK